MTDQATQHTTPLTSQPQSTPKPATKRSRKKLILSIVAVIAAILIFFGAWIFFSTKGAAKISNQFLGSLQTGDFGSSYSLISSEFKKGYSEQQFKDALYNFSTADVKNIKLTNTEVKKESGKPETATLKYSATASDGDYELIVTLIKEDGHWRVFNFDSSKR